MHYDKDHHDIVQALDPDLVRRMRNWVDWRGGGTSSCSSSWVLDYGVHIHSGYREASMPLLVAEAQVVERCLKLIPNELGSAVALFWLAEGMSFVEMAAQLGCTDKTAKARVIRGHTDLQAEVYRQQPSTIVDTKREPGRMAAPRERPTSGPVTVLAKPVSSGSWEPTVLTNTDSEI